MLDTEEMAYRMKLEPITATELAERVGVSRQTIYNLLNGKSQPKRRTLLRICEVLRCSPETLIVSESERMSEHERFAEVLVQRFMRERGDFDIYAAVMDHYYNWLTSEFGDLNDEEFNNKKELSEYEAKDFADFAKRFILLGDTHSVTEETLTEAMREAFSMTFDAILPTMTVDVSDDDLNEA